MFRISVAIVLVRIAVNAESIRCFGMAPKEVAAEKVSTRKIGVSAHDPALRNDPAVQFLEAIKCVTGYQIKSIS